METSSTNCAGAQATQYPIVTCSLELRLAGREFAPFAAQITRLLPNGLSAGEDCVQHSSKTSTLHRRAMMPSNVNGRLCRRNALIDQR
jgi:hypothetical protein